ncbi:MAG: RecX family transcriptional regulator [Planctomycetota bacterium]
MRVRKQAKDPGDTEAAYALALRMLGVRASSRRRLGERLARRGFEREVVEAVVERLVSNGIIDDAALAESVARVSFENSPTGRRLVEAKLLRRGIDRGVAESAARDAAGDRDALADARRLAARKLRTMPASLEPDAVRRRLLGALSRRGFEPEIAREAAEAEIGAAKLWS